MIESYHFGCMVIAGVVYRKDLCLLPGGTVVADWWRQQGHLLVEADLAAVLAQNPKVLIVGTGASGLLRPVAGLVDSLAKRGIEVIVAPTAAAVAEWNRRWPADRERLAAGFHLTC